MFKSSFDIVSDFLASWLSDTGPSATRVRVIQVVAVHLLLQRGLLVSDGVCERAYLINVGER